MPIFQQNAGKKVFYSHVPKTGGTYIEDIFRANKYATEFWHRWPKKISLKCSPQHFHADIFDRFLDIDGFDLAFATVRHPVDRFLSEYRDRTKRNYRRISAFIEYASEQLESNSFAFDNHLRPQVEFLDSRFVVYRQEDGFNTEWAKRMNDEYKLGFTVFSAPRRRNTQEFRNIINAEERTAIINFCQKRYAEDFKRFGYDIESALAFRPDFARITQVDRSIRRRFLDDFYKFKSRQIVRKVRKGGDFLTEAEPDNRLVWTSHVGGGVLPTTLVARNRDRQELWTSGVYSENGRVVKESLLTRFGKLRAIPAEFRVRNASSARVIYAGQLFDHFGHFLLEGLSRLWATESFPDYDVCWSVSVNRQSDELLSWQKSILDRLIGRRRHYLVKESTAFSEVIVPSVGYRIDDHYAQEHKAFLETMGVPYCPVVGRKLWLSRSGIEESRGLINSYVLERHLEPMGWKIWRPETSNLEDQLRIIASAERLAGEEGSAFHTLIFLQNIEALAVDILPRWSRVDRFLKNFELISEAKGFQQNIHTLTSEMLLGRRGSKTRRVAKNFVEHLNALENVIVNFDYEKNTEFPEIMLQDSRTVGQFGGSWFDGPGRIRRGIWLVTDNLAVDPRISGIDQSKLYEMKPELAFEHYFKEFPEFDTVIVADNFEVDALEAILRFRQRKGRVICRKENLKLIHFLEDKAVDSMVEVSGWICFDMA